MNTATLTTDLFEKAPCYSLAHTNTYQKVAEKKSKPIFDEDAIVTGLKMRDRVVINYIYKQCFRQIKFLVTSNSGTQMDAEDIFQDAMVVVYKKIASDTLSLTSSFETFLFSICKHLWLQRLNKREYKVEFKEIADTDQWHDENKMEEHIEESEKYKIFQQHFLKLSATDQKVLTLFVEKNSLREIAHIMGYKSEKYAKHRKYLCKNRLKNSILNDRNYQKICQEDYLTPALINC